MNQNEIDNIKQSMMLCQMRLKNLKPQINDSKNLSEIYNRVLIEKAVLRQELTQKHPSLLKRIINKISLRPKKRICDYFN